MIWAKKAMVSERHHWEEDVEEEKGVIPASPDPDLQKEETETQRDPEQGTELGSGL